jgi:hypothetical protein
MSSIAKGEDRFGVSALRSNNPGMNTLFFHKQCFQTMVDVDSLKQLNCYLCKENIGDSDWFSEVMPGLQGFPSIVCRFCFVSTKVGECGFCYNHWLEKYLSSDVIGRRVCRACERNVGVQTLRSVSLERKQERITEYKYNKIIEDAASGKLFHGS